MNSQYGSIVFTQINYRKSIYQNSNRLHMRTFYYSLSPRHLYLPSKRRRKYNIKWIFLKSCTHFYGFWRNFWCYCRNIAQHFRCIMNRDIIPLWRFVELHSYAHQPKLWHDNSFVMWRILFSFFTHEEFPRALRCTDKSIGTIPFFRTFDYSISDRFRESFTGDILKFQSLVTEPFFYFLVVIVRWFTCSFMTHFSTFLWFDTPYFCSLSKSRMRCYSWCSHKSTFCIGPFYPCILHTISIKIILSICERYIQWEYQSNKSDESQVNFHTTNDYRQIIL